MVNANNICECCFILFSLLKFLAEDNVSHTAHAASSIQHTIFVILLMLNHSLYPKCKLYLIGISKKWIRTKTVAERIPKRIGALLLFEVSFFCEDLKAVPCDPEFIFQFAGLFFNINAVVIVFLSPHTRNTAKKQHTGCKQHQYTNRSFQLHLLSFLSGNHDNIQRICRTDIRIQIHFFFSTVIQGESFIVDSRNQRREDLHDGDGRLSLPHSLRPQDQSQPKCLLHLH